MAKARKIRFVATGENGRFQFHSGDGRVHIVDADGFETGDPAVVALLDGAPGVKRDSNEKAKAKSSGSSSPPAPTDDEGGDG